MILDSDIIIYSALPENQSLRDFVRSNTPSYSAVSLVEVLGYHNLSDYDAEYFEDFFESLNMIAISTEIINGAIKLRQQHKINLGDSLIAATAIVHRFALVTNNLKDFSWIESLELVNLLENK
ncbi:MAG: type II toxin-antitoxin system VapC family toxin [Pyrinomonadaceae bacterium]